MKILTTLTASAGLDVASTGSDTIKLGSANTENNDASVDNLTVWANADFKNNVTLGSNSLDKIISNAPVSASAGLSASFIVGNGSGLTNLNALNGVITAQMLSESFAELSDLTPYATLTGASSSFSTPSQVSNSVTSAIANFPTRTEVTGATNSVLSTVSATYATLTGVSSSFTMPSNITSALTPYLLSSTAATTYATSANISSSFVTNVSATSSLARLAAVNTFNANQIITGALFTTSNISGASNAYFGGKIGIGTANPAEMLTVTRAAGTASYIKVESGANSSLVGHGAGGELLVGTFSNQPVLFYANSAEAARISTAGNIGIGTNSPGDKLDINGGLTVRGTRIYHSASSYQTEFGPGAGTGDLNFHGYYVPSGKGIAILGNGGNSRLFLSGTGIGVGTASPATELDVRGIGSFYSIKFPSNQSASADANTLDDYEEGTWTPDISSSVKNYSTSSVFTHGSYIKIGKIVFIKGVMNITSYGTSSGNVFIRGLPFTSINTTNQFTNIPIPYYLQLSASVIPIALINANSNFIIMQYLSGTSVASMTVSHLTANSLFSFNGFYISNS